MENMSYKKYTSRIKENLTALSKRFSLAVVLVWVVILSSCSVGYRSRGYDRNTDGYYEQQGDYGNDGRIHDRISRHRWEREHRRWHRLHDRDQYKNNNTDHDDEIIIGH